MIDDKRLSVKVFSLGTLFTIVSTAEYYLTNEVALLSSELLVPAFIIEISIFFVSAMIFADEEKDKQKEQRRSRIEKLEDRVQKLEKEASQ